jgi:hypothetical protein
MHYRRRTLLAVTVGASLAIAACGDDDDAGGATTTVDGTAAPGTAAPGTAPEGTEPDGTGGDGEPVSLAGVCPDTVTIQTDWMPEAEHGWLYQLVGEGYEVDAGKAYVTGPLIDSAGNDTGVDIQIRSGGAPQNFSPPTQILYQDDDILLTFVYTDEAIQFSGDFPTVAIESGFEKNPQMIMWDPETYPEVEEIADLGPAGADAGTIDSPVTIRYFGGAAYMDFLTGTGILSEGQVDGSYTGDPSLFIADEGEAAQQGFGSAEPYLYENEYENWGKPVEYRYINDLGWRNYAQSIATKPENIETYRDCFELLVPVIQQGAVDYLNDPARSNAIVLDAVDQFGEDFGWTYTEGTINYGVETMRNDGLVANGPDGVMGKFDLDRVAELIELAVPIYEAQGASPKEGVTPEDIVTNEFIDESIGL